MALRGNLKELSLPDIFQLVMFSGKTGVLRITREDGGQGSVWFRDGDVFFAESDWHAELLGQRLARAQRITPMALEWALQQRSADPAGKRLGQILVEGGYITEKVLEAFVREQIQDTIFDLMRWDEGEFEFVAMPESINEDIGLSISVENVIMEGSRRLEEWSRIKRKIPSTDIVFKMATAPGEGTFEISLKPTEWNLLLLIDGSRSIAELAQATDRTDFEVARVVYGLFSAGLLEVATDEEVAAARAERAVREAETARIAAEIGAAATTAEPSSEREPASGGASVLQEPGRAVLPMPVEVPRFLGPELAEPAEADAEVLEEVIGALFSAPPSELTEGLVVPPAPPPTPAEEPAFIAASQEAEETPGASAVSLEELLAGITLPTEAPESSAEPESAPPLEVVEGTLAETSEDMLSEREVTAAEFDSALLPEQTPAQEPVPEIEVAPEAGAESEAVAEPEPVQLPELEPLEIPEPEPVSDFEFIPVEPVIETVEAEPPDEEEMAPGTFVVVPQPDQQPEMPEEQAAPAPASVAEEVVDTSVPAADEIVLPEPVASLGATATPAPSGLSASGEELAAAVDRPRLLANVPEVLPSTPAPSTPEVPEPTAPRTAPSDESEAATFEHDLMALGLGELPAELQAIEPQDEVPLSPELEVAAPEILPEMQVARDEGVPAEAPASSAERGADFSALLESLDIGAEDEESAAASTAAAPADEDAAPRVISTDAYLGDLNMGDELGLEGDLSQELSALTGADRPPRPSASVKKLPAKGETVLRRDARVDRDTLLKVIEGIKNL